MVTSPGPSHLTLGGSGCLRDPRLACFVPWDIIGASRDLGLLGFSLCYALEAPARPGLSLTQPRGFFGGSLWAGASALYRAVNDRLLVPSFAYLSMSR